MKTTAKLLVLAGAMVALSCGGETKLGVDADVPDDPPTRCDSLCVCGVRVDTLYCYKIKRHDGRVYQCTDTPRRFHAE